MAELRSRTRPLASTKKNDNSYHYDDGLGANDKLFFGSHRKAGGSKKGLIETASNLMTHQWSLLPWHSKIVAALAFLAFASYTSVGIIDLCFHYHGYLGVINAAKIQSTGGNFSSFSVVIDISSSSEHTTPSVDDTLLQTVQHYADSCGRGWGVDHVYIMTLPEGNGFSSISPDFPLLPKLPPSTSRNAERRRRNRAQAHIVTIDSVAPHRRFWNLSNSSNAIFLVDRKIRVHCRALGKAFQSFRSAPYSMSGFYPRLALPPATLDRKNNINSNLTIEYYGWPKVFWNHRFNFVSTKASFLHKHYLTLYGKDDNDSIINNEIRAYVQQNTHCERFVLPILVAAVRSREDTDTTSSSAANSDTRRRFPAIFVEGWASESTFILKAILSAIQRFFWRAPYTYDNGHNVLDPQQSKSKCLSDLTRLFLRYPEGGNNDGTESSVLTSPVPLRDHSWLHHSPGFFWQSRPANVLEWFAWD